ncbi:hypothetical protein [Chryseobacterium carnipullorum]|uniref:hypothetical protein n=1 Tax=Chryseobacterium carnipullorum TaxID=1124835 RepID=UPI000E9A7E8E|nr:hypothetical protein [Chryseobacterium carnipullorum]HBV14944.1 hypothetical protein [Chryseobacterium carnipullorum]
MNNTIQTEKNNISKININAISDINKFINSSCNQEEKSNEALHINVPFGGYHDLMSEISSLLDIIHILAWDSTISEGDKVDNIRVLATMVKKILPMDEAEFLDKLIFKDHSSKEKDFMNIENFQKKNYNGD